MMSEENPLTGWLITQGWGGVHRQKVEIIGATPKRFRIRAIERTKLAGRSRWLNPGETALVPQHAVRDNCDFCQGTKGGIPGNENRIEGADSGLGYKHPYRLICDYCHSERMVKCRCGNEFNKGGAGCSHY